MFSGTYNNRQGAHPPDFETSVIPRAAAAGVRRIILTGTDLAESRAALDLAVRINAGSFGVRCFSTVGLHPTSAARELAAEEERGVGVGFGGDCGGGGVGGGAAAALLRYEASLLALAREGVATGVVVAIGECGLDWDRLHFSPRESQEAAFPMHVRLARATGLPLFLHDRNTNGALLAALHAEGGAPAGGVVHSFTGTNADLDATLAIANLYVGINGCALKTIQGAAVASRIPLNRLLLETDSPWCSIKASSPAAVHIATTWPTVKKEKWQPDAMVKDRSEPCQVVTVAEALAGLIGCSLADIALAAEANATALFFSKRE